MNAMILMLAGIVSLFLALLVAKDADHRSNSTIGWFFITLFTGVLGVLVYLLVRAPRHSRYARRSGR